MAARLASALDLAPCISAHVLGSSRPWVTWVSILVIGIRTSPAVVALIGLAVAGWSTLQNIQLPTRFLVPPVPALLELALHADMAVARTTCCLSDKSFASSSRSTMEMWSSLLWPTTDRSTSLTATCNDANVSRIVPVDPGSQAAPGQVGSAPACPSAVHSKAATTVVHVGGVVTGLPRVRPRTLPPSLGCAGTAAPPIACGR
jgi:hypothetical protein